VHLADFILENTEPILAEWEAFARTILPVTAGMTQQQLRDEAERILRHIAHDMKLEQTDEEQQAKAEGRRAIAPPGNGASAAEVHSTDRQTSGFTLIEMVSEYRALRASVIRLWTKGLRDGATPVDLYQLTRFNEALDEFQSDSIMHFTKKLDHSRDLVLAVLGHDLRDPLSVIVTYATYLRRLDRFDENARTAVGRLFTTATRMRLMVSDLLDFARARLGAVLPITRAPMDINEACRRAIDEVETLHPRSTLCMRRNGPLEGEWDPVRISQLLTNLLGNAVQHGSSEKPVDVILNGDENEVSITVHNEGTPIPANELQRIFEPMVRGSREQATPSSIGLGLYIAREVVRAHGGRIKVQSSADAGTTFTVSLPRVAPPAP
jgi:signal transduction histidine kinase